MAEVPLLQQLYSKYEKRGLRIIGISLDEEVDKVKSFVAQKGVAWPQVCDGKADEGVIPKLYNVDGTPDLYVIDRAGRIAARTYDAKMLDPKLAEVTTSGSRVYRLSR